MTLRTWWHQRRHAHCGICGREFRKGKGGGISRRVVCSDPCYAEGWRQLLAPRRAEPHPDTDPSP